VKCKVSESPKTVSVERNGQAHHARWRQRGGNDGELFEVQGDENLLRAVLTAWDGEREFELTDQELVARGDGWWAP
jgi:hypothetical protein